MHCQTSGVSLTAQDPYNNVVRTTLEGLAAVFGGTQSLHTNAFDEALALPTDASARLARNTQLILQLESGATDVVDPWGGSYFMEARTHELAEQARAHIQEVLEVGGMTVAVERGIAQRKIELAAARRQARLDQELDVLVGVNRFRLEEEPPAEIRNIDNHAVLSHQMERLGRVRASRDSTAVDEKLAALARAAAASDNLVPPCIDAMRARATVGEVSLVLEQAFGRHRAAPGGVRGVFASHYRDDPKFEALKERVRRLAEREGRPPRVLVAKLGQDGHDRGAKVVAAGLGDLGFDVDIGPLFQTPSEVARDAVDNDVHVVGVSTQAGAHRALLAELCQELQRRGAGDVIVVCGGVIPQVDHEPLRQLGVSAIFEPGAVLVNIGDELLRLLEARPGHGS
jgi:methylmalonyl-CoA mutase